MPAIAHGVWKDITDLEGYLLISITGAYLVKDKQMQWHAEHRVRGGPDPDAHPRRDGRRQGEGATEGQAAEIVQNPAEASSHDAGEHPQAELAELFRVSRALSIVNSNDARPTHRSGDSA